MSPPSSRPLQYCRGLFFYILFRRYSYKIRKALGVKAFLKKTKHKSK